MSTWPTSLHRYPFVVARSDRVGSKPVAVTLLGRPLVLARLGGSRVACFEDRCPHRQAPLSAGRIVHDSLQCPYHGWRFDRSGALVELPGMPEGGCLPGVRARTIEVTEHQGLIWVRLEGDGPIKLPGMVRQLAAESRRFLWHATWQAGAVDILENVLDPMHTHFVHRGLVRFGADRHDITARYSPTAEGFSVEYTGNDRQSGFIYHLFESPREFERAHFSAPGSAQLEYAYRNGSRVRISLHVSPESDRRSQVFGTLHIDGRWAPAWGIRMFVWPFIRRVARQDAEILAMQSANASRFSKRRDVITPYDMVRRQLLSVWDADFQGAPQDSLDRKTRLRL